MTLRLITAPSAEPATVDEVKLDARIDGPELDATIELLIKAARQRCEDLTGRALITQTWELVLDEFPVDGIRVGKLPDRVGHLAEVLRQRRHAANAGREHVHAGRRQAAGVDLRGRAEYLAERAV